MEAAAWFASAIGFAVAMSASPGPNNALIATAAANFGLRRSLPQLAGVALGFPAMMLLLAVGLAEPLRHSATAQEVLRWAGGAWLLWLAWKIAAAEPDAATPERRGRPMTLLESALFQWVNPKAWIIAGGSLATYTGTRLGVLPDALVLAAIFVLAAVLSLLGWAVIGLGAARLLTAPARLRRFNQAMGVLLALSVLPMLR
jgi:threonine/homoserine/homoserine lactone efflux protein